MKKSEFIKKLKRKVSNKYVKESYLERLVDHCIDLGMLPMSNLQDILDFNGEKLGEHFVCEWEPEDE